MSTITSLFEQDSADPSFIRAKHMAEYDFELVQELARWREKRGFTQKDIAEMMGVTPQAISKFERYDGNHNLASIRRYANAIGVVVTHQVLDDSERQVSNPRHDRDTDVSQITSAASAS